MNTLFAAGYDDHWGHINRSHAEFIGRFTTILAPGDEILDAACGTGKYWPTLHRADLRIIGVDHSEAMLENARAKDPTVSTQCCALQEVAAIPEFTGRFAGLICVDAIENIGPEDWPRTLGGLRSTLRQSAPAYLTMELPDPADKPDPPDDPAAPLVNGEVLDGGAYHYYPAETLVAESLDSAGFRVLHAGEGDGYRHLLCIA